MQGNTPIVPIQTAMVLPRSITLYTSGTWLLHLIYKLPLKMGVRDNSSSPSLRNGHWLCCMRVKCVSPDGYRLSSGFGLAVLLREFSQTILHAFAADKVELMSAKTPAG